MQTGSPQVYAAACHKLYNLTHYAHGRNLPLQGFGIAMTGGGLFRF